MATSKDMSSLLIVTLCAFAVLTIKGVAGQCNAATATQFIEIPPDEYSREYAAIEDDGNRPLGFEKGVVQFGGSTNPCVSMMGVGGGSVEILFETVPEMKLCYQDQTGKLKCQEGRLIDCREAGDENLYIEFFCDTSRGCSESDVTFWYRLTKGPSSDPEGMWCHWRDNEFPEDLQSIPVNVDVPSANDNDGDNNAGAPLVNYVAWMLISACAAFLIVL